MSRLGWGLVVGCLAVALVAGGCHRERDESLDSTRLEGEYPGLEASESWPRRGGPNGDFMVGATGLADSWPTAGPPVVWQRPLGSGWSGVTAREGALFTMYRDGELDVVVALRADNGETVWEHRYDAPTRRGNETQFGVGPNATPLVLDDRVVSLGYTGQLRCLDLRSGELLWSLDLVDELGGELLEFGNSASPILHDGKVIVLVGGERHGVVAFDPVDGSVAWSGPPSSVRYATPIVIDLDGQEQLIYFTSDEILGLDADDGAILWSHAADSQYRNNANEPIWNGDDHLLWMATDEGARVLRLTRDEDATRVEELWASNRMSIAYWGALRLGDQVFASVGSNGAILVGVDVRSGEILWRERGFEQANFVHAGDRTILLDGNGQLALVDLGREGISVRSRFTLTEGPTWTAPTLIGTKLYVRDGVSLWALELGTGAGQTTPPA